MGESEARRLAILIIDEEFPWPLNSGKRIRTFSLVRQLARTHAVHYLGYGSDDTRALEPFREQNICCHPVSPRNSRQHGIKFLFNLAFNLLSPLPYIVTSHYTRRFAESLRRVCGSLAPDIILCEWTPYAIYLKGSRIPSIIVAHNIESDIWRRYEENEKNAARRGRRSSGLSAAAIAGRAERQPLPKKTALKSCGAARHTMCVWSRTASTSISLPRSRVRWSRRRLYLPVRWTGGQTRTLQPISPGRCSSESGNTIRRPLAMWSDARPHGRCTRSTRLRELWLREQWMMCGRFLPARR